MDQREFTRALKASYRFSKMEDYARGRIEAEMNERVETNAPLTARLGAILGRAIAFGLQQPVIEARGEYVSLLVRGKPVRFSREEYERRALCTMWDHFRLSNLQGGPYPPSMSGDLYRRV